MARLWLQQNWPLDKPAYLRFAEHAAAQFELFQDATQAYDPTVNELTEAAKRFLLHTAKHDYRDLKRHASENNKDVMQPLHYLIGRGAKLQPDRTARGADYPSLFGHAAQLHKREEGQFGIDAACEIMAYDGALPDDETLKELIEKIYQSNIDNTAPNRDDFLRSLHEQGVRLDPETARDVLIVALQDDNYETAMEIVRAYSLSPDILQEDALYNIEQGHNKRMPDVVIELIDRFDPTPDQVQSFFELAAEENLTSLIVHLFNRGYEPENVQKLHEKAAQGYSRSMRSRRGSVEVFEQLMRREYTPDNPEPLFAVAARNGNETFVRVLMQHGAKPSMEQSQSIYTEQPADGAVWDVIEQNLRPRAVKAIKTRNRQAKITETS